MRGAPSTASLFVFLMASNAGAQSGADSAAAQALFDDGRRLLEEGRAAEACPKLHESQRLDPGSGTLLNLAKCYQETGRLASAWSTYLEAASLSATAGNLSREATAREAAVRLQPRLSYLIIEVAADARPTGLAVTRDGTTIGGPQWGLRIPTDEGEHTIAATAPGRKSWQTVVVVKGEGSAVGVSVPKLATAPVDHHGGSMPASGKTSGGLGTQRILAIVSAGIGVAGVGVGTVFGLNSKAKHDEADTYCDGPACRDARGVTAAEAAQSAGNVATVGFVVGAVGLVGGITLWATAPTASSRSTEVAVGPGLVELRSTW